MRKNLVIIGCSYSHWHDSKALYESYPALIAQDFNDYDVYDLSVGGGGNSTAYMRCKNVEDKYKIKIDKVIFQITHYSRLFIHTDKSPGDYSSLFIECGKKDNYFYTSGRLNPEFGFNVTSNLESKEHQLENRYHSKTCKKFIEKEITSWRGEWETSQQIELLHSIYDAKFFSWFDYKNHALDKMLTNKSCIGHILDFMGSSEIFKEQSIDGKGHLTADGHKILYDAMKPTLEKWLEK